MTNTVIVVVCTSLLTNWVTIENKQVGVLVEVRSVEIEGKRLELSRTIIDQKLIRELPPIIQSYSYTNYQIWLTNLAITNLAR